MDYLPKEQRKNILLLSDDIRITSGIGVMSREIVEKTCGHFNWIQLGAAMRHPDVGNVIDMSAELTKITGIPDVYCRIYPYNGYGDPRILRELIKIESPAAIFHFTDPRYWIWLYEMEREIRQHIPILYLNIWDDLPDPKYNADYYKSCDALFSISKQTFGINYRVLGKENVEVIEN